MKRYKKPAKSREMQILAGTRPTSVDWALKFVGISANRLPVILPQFLDYLIAEKKRALAIAKAKKESQAKQEVD